MHITVPNFIKIGQMVAEIWWLFDFSRWRPSAILDLIVRHTLGPSTKSVGLYHPTKFGWNPLRSFCNTVWKFEYFARNFGWEMPIHDWVSFRRFDPLNESSINCNPQKAHPSVKTRRMTYKWLKSVHCCDLCAWVRNQEKKDKEPEQWQTGYSPSPPTSSHTVLHGGWPSGGIVLIFKFYQNRLKWLSRF